MTTPATNSTRTNTGPGEPPFSIGDRVTMPGALHFGVMTVVDCEWIVPRMSAAPYWRVTAASEPTIHPEYPEGSCGIVVQGDTSAGADRFLRATGERG